MVRPRSHHELGVDSRDEMVPPRIDELRDALDRRAHVNAIDANAEDPDLVHWRDYHSLVADEDGCRRPDPRDSRGGYRHRGIRSRGRLTPRGGCAGPTMALLRLPPARGPRRRPDSRAIPTAVVAGPPPFGAGPLSC